MASAIGHAGDATDRAAPRGVATQPVLGAERVIAAVALLFSAYLLLNLASFGHGRDQAIYTVVGKGMLDGAVPYRDLWDFKPPGIFFLFAAAHAVFGPGPQAVRLLEALCFASLPWAFAIFSRRHLGSALAGLIGAAFAILVHVQLEFWNTAQPESFAAVALAWALVAASYEPAAGDARPRLRTALAWLAAGALYGCAALLKPPLGGGIVASAALLAWRGWRTAGRRRAPGLAPALLLGAGALLPLTLTAAYFAAHEAVFDLYETLAVFAPHYTALGLRDASLPILLGRAVVDWLVGFGPLNPVGLLALAVIAPAARREREGVLHVAGVVAFVLIGVALQAKFFAYHFGAAVVLTSLPAGWGFWKLWRLLRRWQFGSLAAATVTVALIAWSNPTPGPGRTGDPFWTRCSLRLVAWLNPSTSSSTNEYLYSLLDMNAATNRQVADWLRANTLPGSAVYVWGFEPAIYDLAARRPASRYIYNVPQRAEWNAPTARRRLMEDLSTDPPAAVAVQHGDRFAWVTGNDSDSATALSGFPELQTMLERDYRPAHRLPDFDLYRR